MLTKTLALATAALAAALLTGCTPSSDTAAGTSNGDAAAKSSAAKTPAAQAKTTKKSTAAAKSAGPKKLADQGWTVESNALHNDGIGDFGGTSRITNTGETKTAILTLTVFKSGKQVGVLSGTANAVASGKTVTVQWSSQDKFVAGPYTYDFQVDAAF